MASGLPQDLSETHGKTSKGSEERRLQVELSGRHGESGHGPTGRLTSTEVTSKNTHPTFPEKIKLNSSE